MAIAQKTKLSDSIISEMRQMLIRGEIKEGSKLPNQDLFAEQLGVSRLTLREALHTLELMGLVEQTPRKGTTILNGNPDLWTKHYVPPFSGSATINRDLVYARNVIETGLAPLGFQNATREDIQKAGEILRAMMDALDSPASEYAALDASFHMILVNASGNEYLTQMYTQLAVANEQFLTHYYTLYPSLRMDAIRYHTSILNALNEPNEEKFMLVMRDHLRSIETIVKRLS